MFVSTENYVSFCLVHITIGPGVVIVVAMVIITNLHQMADSFLFFVADCSTDIISKNIALATQKIQPYNVMPVYGMLLS